jgi:hypothetical protein
MRKKKKKKKKKKKNKKPIERSESNIFFFFSCSDLPLMSAGIHEARPRLSLRPSDPIPAELHKFLDKFNRGRLGLRLLISHHVALHNAQRLASHPSSADPSSSARFPPRPSPLVGLVHPACPVAEIIEAASRAAGYAALHHYDFSCIPPEVEIDPVVRGKGRLAGMAAKDATVPVIPSLLQHVFFELLKNAVRATVDRFGTGAASFPRTFYFVSLFSFFFFFFKPIFTNCDLILKDALFFFF